MAFPWALHIPDQVLLPTWWILGWVGAILWVMAASRGIEDEEIPRIGLFSAVFFLGTLFHLPFFSVHLLLPGVMGLFLGNRAILAILVAMLLQAGMGHGGFSTAGINTLIMGAPACLSWWLVLPVVKRLYRHPTAFAVAGFCLGFVPVALAVLLHALALYFGGVVRLDWQVIVSIPLHLPVALAEGIFLASALPFLAAAGIPPFGAKESEPVAPDSEHGLPATADQKGTAAMSLGIILVCVGSLQPGWAHGIEVRHENVWHKLQIDWKILPGNQLQVDAYFETGPDIETGELIVKDEKGVELLREAKHKAGRFVVALPESHRAIDLYVHAEDHLAHVHIPSKAFLGAAGPAKENPQVASSGEPEPAAVRKGLDPRDSVLGLSLILSASAFWMALRALRKAGK